MNGNHIVAEGTRIGQLNNYQDLYEYNGVRYAVQEEYNGDETRFWATAL
jgi:hypothetical protein